MIVIDFNNEACWQNSFLEILPEIKRRLRMAFCRLSEEAREEAMEEAIVSCLLAYARLYEQGRTASVTPSTLAWYAALQVKSGRPTVGSMNGSDPLSRYAQLENGIQIERLDSKWIDVMVEDKRAAVPDQVAAKLDVGAWFATLSRRMKQIAKDLAFGFSTSEVARKYGVTAGRISQLRRALENSWAEFQKESVPAVA
jgi:hypothetical protein